MAEELRQSRPEEGDANDPRRAPEAPDCPLPGWLQEFHTLDRDLLLRMCIDLLPRRLGFRNAALYLYEPHSDALRLTGSCGGIASEAWVRPADVPEHPFARAIRAGRIVLQGMRTPSAGQTSGTESGFSAQRTEGPEELIAPLRFQRELCGLLHLRGAAEPEPSISAGAVGPRGLKPAARETRDALDAIFAAIARALHNARQYARVHAESRIDALTGLLNYRWAVETLEREIERARRFGNALAAILIDLDGLKCINDAHGHCAGDAVLRHTAGLLRASLRQIDAAARIGGDEFLIILPRADAQGAREAADRILAAIRDNPAESGALQFGISASLGIAAWQPEWGVMELLDAADCAMYEAKRCGRDRLSVHA